MIKQEAIVLLMQKLILRVIMIDKAINRLHRSILKIKKLRYKYNEKL